MGLPIEIDPLLMSGAAAGYSVSKSLRFRSSASAYLNRASFTAPNLKTWTWSGWVKRGALSSTFTIFGSYDGTSASASRFYFNTSDQLAFDFGGAAANTVSTTAVYRDPSAWYHVILTVDTTQATAANRVLLWVNGVSITSFSSATYPTQNTNGQIWSANQAQIGQRAGNYFDGYMAEVNFIDGQSLTPSSFGAYDTNGVWQPLQYSGTYGTNGFYLPFTNTTSTATLGNDFSGNGNTWTVNNISLTAGATYDSMVDSPTVSSTSVANYATLNPLDFQNANTYSNGNLSVSLQAATASMAFAGFGLQSGKWYWEVKTTAGADPTLGIATQAGTLASRYWNGANSVYYYGGSGVKYVAGVSSAYGATYGTANTIGIALDLSANTITYYKDNVSQGVISLPSGIIGQILVPAFSSATGTAVQSMNVNFGQRPFTYTPPSGFNPLNTYNLPSPTILNGAQYMASTLYTGTGATATISNGTNNTIGTSFKPDFVWIKSRSAATNHNLFDALRGTTAYINANTTAISATNANTLTAFGSTGFTLGSDASAIGVNVNTATYDAWQWRASNVAGVSNTNGSITSTVSANQAAGFSVVTYTGTGANATVGHGLGVAPNMLLIKKTSGTTTNWAVYHSAVGNSAALSLNQATGTNTTSAFWQNTTPTSTVFSVGTSGDNNPSGATLVAYCWSAVSGYSAFGSYTGNGNADGPFIYCGFKPRFVLIKIYSTTGDWYLWDTSRSTFNVVSATLLTDSAAAETSATSIDILSNGFKCRSATVVNASAATYAYAAFAENPFQISRAQ